MDEVERQSVERLLGVVANKEKLLQIACDEIERLNEQLHYANGTCDLAMKHRDIAEADNERLRADNEWLRGIIHNAIAAQDFEIARAALKETKP